MTPPISDLSALLRSMNPELNTGAYAFLTLNADAVPDLRNVVACIREPEGWSVVVPVAEAARHGTPPQDCFAWITLSVYSDLQAVGLTAAFAAALGEQGISCNVVAGHHHDHIFVPLAQADAAMAALKALQRGETDLAAGGAGQG